MSTNNTIEQLETNLNEAINPGQSQEHFMAELSELMYSESLNSNEPKLDVEGNATLYAQFYNSDGQVRKEITGDVKQYLQNQLTTENTQFLNKLKDYNVVALSGDNWDGYAGMVISPKGQNNKGILVSRGSENPITHPNDWGNNAEMWAANGIEAPENSLQFQTAQQLLSDAQVLQPELVEISTTGHSQGAAIAIALEKIIYQTDGLILGETYAFNPPGFASSAIVGLDFADIEIIKSKTHIYSVAGDPVSETFSDQLVTPEIIYTSSDNKHAMVNLVTADQSTFNPQNNQYLNSDGNLDDIALADRLTLLDEVIESQEGLLANKSFSENVMLEVLNNFGYGDSTNPYTILEAAKLEKQGLDNMLGTLDGYTGVVTNHQSITEINEFMATAAGGSAGEALLNTLINSINNLPNAQAQKTFLDILKGATILGEILSYDSMQDILIDIADQLADENRQAQEEQIFQGDPLTLDLDGDGIETVSVNEGVLFDHEHKQVREGTGWVSGDDGLLVRDLDNSNTIDSGRELFGDNTIKSDGTKAINGFDALSDLDSNADGIFDANDEAFDEVQLWQDANSDGVSQAEELTSLKDAGVESIDLSHESINQATAGGVISDIGSYTKSDGSTADIGNLFLDKEPARSEFTDDITISEELLNSGIDIRGIGAVRNLNQAASLNPNLATILIQVTKNPAAELSTANLLMEWAKSSDFSDTLSLESLVLEDGTSFKLDISNDVRFRLEQIQVLETFTGNKIIQTSIDGDQLIMTYGSVSMSYNITAGQENVLGNSIISNGWRVVNRTIALDISQIERSYQKLFDNVDESLFSQIIYPKLVKDLKFDMNTETGDVNINFDGVNNFLAEILHNDAQKGVDLVTKLINENEFFKGGDWLNNNLLENEFAGALSEIYNAEVELVDIQQKIYKVDEKLYTVGSNFIIAGDGSDYLEGSLSNDNIYGEDGSDYLVEQGGTNILSGGQGDDGIVIAGNSTNTILYNLGDGFDDISIYKDSNESTDKIVFGEGITQEMLNFSRGVYDSVIININNDPRQGIKLDNGMNLDFANIKTFHFADGTLLSLDDIRNTIINQEIEGTLSSDNLEGGIGNNVISGLDGNDTLVDSNGNNIFIGGKGNDEISMAGEGVNIIKYELGDGFDTIYSQGEKGSEDNIVFGWGIDKEDLRFSQENGSIIVYIGDDPSQGMKLVDALDTNSNTKIKEFYFNDGTSLSLDEVRYLLSDRDIKGTASADILRGSYGNDIISGLDENDILVDELGGDNIFIGGKGNDKIASYTRDSNNIIKYNLGDGFDDIYIYKDSSESIDKIVFGEGITKDNITLSFKRGKSDLIININDDPNQGLRIGGVYESQTGNFVNLAFEFANGEYMNASDIRSATFDETIEGTINSDKLNGQEGNDILLGLEGDDKLVDRYGDNTFIGGQGDDTIISEGLSNNTIKYDLGDGFDVIKLRKRSADIVDEIVFGDGITKDNINISLDRNYNLLVIINNDPNQGMRIKDVFRGDHIVNTSFKFANGDTIASDEVYDIVFGKNILGTSTSDYLDGGYGDDILIGDQADDILIGRSGEDTLIGGSGNDTLFGGEGTDTYVFNKGDGVDTIVEVSAEKDKKARDVISFGDELSKEDISFMRKGEDIYVTFKNSKEDQLIIKDFQKSTIKLFEFSDGTKLNKSDIEIGGDDSDTLVANRNNNILIGGRGDDILKARAGDDTLIGGLGNDIINGQSGNNTIVYNLGDGLDIIKADKISDTNHTDNILFGEGISNENLNYIRKGKDLFIQVDGNPTQGLLVEKFYKSNKYETKVQSLSFTNGEIIDLSTVQPITFGTDSNDVIRAKKGYTNHIDAKDGNDKLKGSDKDDILIGGQGDDILAGGAGSDTYEYSTGDGSTDTLKLNDISKDDILFSRADNDLQINFKDQLSSIIVDDYFESQYNDALIIDANDEFQMQLAANANKMAEILAANVSDDDIDGGSVGGGNQVSTQVDASQLADLWVPKNNDSV